MSVKGVRPVEVSEHWACGRLWRAGAWEIERDAETAAKTAARARSAFNLIASEGYALPVISL
jgi:hypothetical protein